MTIARLNWHEVTTKPIEIHHCTLSDGRKLQIDIIQKDKAIEATVRLLHPHWYQFEIIQTFVEAFPLRRMILKNFTRPKYFSEMTEEEKKTVFPTPMIEDTRLVVDRSDEATDLLKEQQKDLFEKLFLLAVDYCESLFGDIEQAKAEIKSFCVHSNSKVISGIPLQWQCRDCLAICRPLSANPEEYDWFIQ